MKKSSTYTITHKHNFLLAFYKDLKEYSQENRRNFEISIKEKIKKGEILQLA